MQDKKFHFNYNATLRGGWQAGASLLIESFGYDPNHCIVRASQEGLQAVLFKPFKVEQLLSEIRKALQSQPVKR